VIVAYTVGEALEDYFRYRTARSPSLSVQTDKSRARAHIDDELRARPVAKLTTGELETWYHAMVRDTNDRELQRRAQATADRVRRLFFAVLNHAYRNRHDAVPSADAWRAVRTFRNFDRPRRRFISVEEAKRLLNAMPPDFRSLARGALYTGLRWGELLALRVTWPMDRFMCGIPRAAQAARCRFPPRASSSSRVSQRASPAMRWCSCGTPARIGSACTPHERCGVLAKRRK